MNVLTSASNEQTCTLYPETLTVTEGHMSGRGGGVNVQNDTANMSATSYLQRARNKNDKNIL